MSFANTLSRLREAVVTHHRGRGSNTAVIQKRDLAELLQDYDRIDTAYRELHAENERLRGLVPDLPPRPPEGDGLPRYGLRWNGPGQPLGHLAEAQSAALQQCGKLHRQMAPTSDQDYELWHALRRALDGGGIALPSSAKLRAELPLYHCRGKGGQYELIGYDEGARQCATMQRPVSECGCPDCGSSLVEWPVGIDSEGGSCD